MIPLFTKHDVDKQSYLYFNNIKMLYQQTDI